MYLGLDLGAKFGWALIDEDGDLRDSGTWILGKRSGKSLQKLRDHLIDTLAEGVIAVGYEKVHGRHSSKNAAHAYGGYEALVWLCCRDAGIENEQLLQVTVQAVKKLATGFTDADKEEVEAAVLSRWDYIPDDDNEADAIFIAEFTRLKFSDDDDI